MTAKRGGRLDAKLNCVRPDNKTEESWADGAARGLCRWITATLSVSVQNFEAAPHVSRACVMCTRDLVQLRFLVSSVSSFRSSSSFFWVMMHDGYNFEF